MIQGGATVTLAEGGRAHFSGLETCGSVWACPVCAPKVRAVRAGELERFAVGWIGAGRGLAMATFTIRHHRHERLSDQVAGLASAWRRMVAGRPWRRLREDFKLHGYTKAEEITHGENGWHPHFHVLLWSKAPLNKERADRLNDQLHALWYTACEREGLGLPTRAHGVQVDPVRRGKDGARDIARYVAKVQDGAGVERAMGNEMIRGDLKSGRKDSRTPFEVARDFTRTGDIADLERWQEYERATRGRKALTWSRGLKAELAALLELQADDRDDQAIAAEQIGGEQLATVPRAVWYRHVVAVPGRRLALLRAAEALGQVGVRVLIESWELEWGRDVLIPPAPVQTRAA